MLLRCCLLLLVITSLAALEQGDRSPGFAGVTWLGEAPAADRPVLVDLFSSRLPPVLDTVPVLTAVAARHRDAVAVVGLSAENREALRDFQRRLGPDLGYPVGAAPAALFERWRAGVRGLPHSFLIGADGSVLWHGHPLDAEAAIRQHLP